MSTTASKMAQLLHGGLGGGRLDVGLDLFGQLLKAVHLPDLAADFVLVGLDAPVRVDLLGPEVVHDLHGPLAEDVLLEDVGQRRLGVHGKDQHPVALLGQMVAGRGGKRGLPQAALAPEHQVAALRMSLEQFCQRNGSPPVKLSAISGQLMMQRPILNLPTGFFVQ